MSGSRDLEEGMGTTSQAIRRAIVRGHKQGKTYQEIAWLLGIGQATVNRILRRWRETGSVRPRRRGGGNFSPIRGKVARLLRYILTDMRDATVIELTEALTERGGIKTSRSSVQRAVHRLGYTRKKVLPRGRAGHAAQCCQAPPFLRADRSGPPAPARVPRRVLLCDWHAARVRLGSAGTASVRHEALHEVEDALSHRSHPAGFSTEADDPSRPGERACVSPLRAPAALPVAEAPRRRGDGQPAGAQDEGGE